MLRPKQISNSEQNVTKVTEVVENEYINPFGLDVDKNSLVDVSSGMSLPEEITDKVLYQRKKGKGLVEVFTNNRLLSSNVKFYKAVTKKDSKTYIVKSKRGVQAIGEVN